MFNSELWTNLQWSFGWPPTLFVWMGRRRARIVYFSLVSYWRLALELPRFAFGVYRVGLWFRGVYLFYFHYVMWRFLFTQCVESKLIFGDVVWYVTWLFGGVLFIWWDVIIVPLRYLRILFMHVELIEEVTSKSFALICIFA